jgi:hypothetical protein
MFLRWLFFSSQRYLLYKFFKGLKMVPFIFFAFCFLSLPHCFAQEKCTSAPNALAVDYSIDHRFFPKEFQRVSYSENGTDAFFGFYYPTPWNKEETMFLSTQREPSDDFVSLFVYDENRTKVKIGDTSAFNSPEGARLQWLGSTKKVVHNARSSQGVQAEVLQVDFPVIRPIGRLNLPVYSLSPDGRMGASLNFIRLFCFSSEGTYGYAPSGNLTSAWDRELSILIPSDDGIQIFDLLDEPLFARVRAVITPRAVINFLLRENACLNNGWRIGEWIENYYVWLEQPKFSSNGKRLLFMARAKERLHPQESLQNLQSRKYINLGIFTVDANGENLWYADGFPVSHFDFVDDELLLCGNDGMAVTRDRFGSGTVYKSNVASEDGIADVYAGHCTYHPHDKHLILTDTSCTKCTVPCHPSLSTCAEGSRGRYIGVLDTRNRTLYVVGMFSVDISVPENAFVDLHPRFSPSGNQIMIDSQYTGRASQYVLDITSILQHVSHVSLPTTFSSTVAAVLFEVNCSPQFVRALVSAVTNLPGHVIYVVKTWNNKNIITDDPTVNDLVSRGRVKVLDVTHMSEVTHRKKMDRPAMRRIVYSPEFWKLFTEDALLWFHSDTVFCKHAEGNLKSLLLRTSGRYPFVGPIGRRANYMIGGLSVRQPHAFLQASYRLPSLHKGNFSALVNSIGGEDVKFGQVMKLNARSDTELRRIANTFFLDAGHPIPRDPSHLIAVHLNHGAKAKNGWGDIAEFCPDTEKVYEEVRSNFSYECPW